MKSIIIFIFMVFFFHSHAVTCDHLVKVEFLGVVAEEEIVQAYRRGAFDVAYYQGRSHAMGTAAFEIQKSTGPCQCISILTKLADKAEQNLDYAEKFSHWAGDTWYWMGAFNAYNDILEAIDP